MSTCFSKQIVADEWFNAIAGYKQLPAEIVEQLDDDGLVTIPGPISSNQMSRIAAAYDQAGASIQGAFIRRDAPSGLNLPARMCSDTLARISPSQSICWQSRNNAPETVI